MEERKISLRKERVVSLTKSREAGGEGLSTILVGLKWGQVIVPARRIGGRKVIEKIYTGNMLQKLFKFGPYTTTESEVGGYTKPATTESADLDASILIYGKNKELIDKVYFGKLKSTDGSITHAGDDRSGGGKVEYNEKIEVQLDKVANNAEYLVVILNSYSGHRFDNIPYASMNIDVTKKKGSDSTVAEFNVANDPEFIGKVAMVLGVFYREEANWAFKAIGVATSESSIGAISRGSALDAVKSL